MERIERSFGDVEYERKKKRTRRKLFLERMEGLIPWGKLVERIRPYYPTVGKGRVHYPLEGMLRVHCVQLFYNLSDPAMEDMLYEVESVRRFSDIRLETDAVKSFLLVSLKENRLSTSSNLISLRCFCASLLSFSTATE